MTVQNSADSPADFGVEIDGYGTSANQDFVMLSPADDTSPESARAMLTVTPAAFHLEANATQDLTVTAALFRRAQAPAVDTRLFLFTLLRRPGSR